MQEWGNWDTTNDTCCDRHFWCAHPFVLRNWPIPLAVWACPLAWRYSDNCPTPPTTNCWWACRSCFYWKQTANRWSSRISSGSWCLDWFNARRCYSPCHIDAIARSYPGTAFLPSEPRLAKNAATHSALQAQSLAGRWWHVSRPSAPRTVFISLWTRVGSLRIAPRSPAVPIRCFGRCLIVAILFPGLASAQMWEQEGHSITVLAMFSSRLDWLIVSHPSS